MPARLACHMHCVLHCHQNLQHITLRSPRAAANRGEMGPISMEFLKLLRVVPRITQILFCILCLATAAATAHTFGQATPGAVGLAVFAAVSGLLISSVLVLADLLNTSKLSRTFKGLLDFILSLLWAVFFLSAGAAVAGFGTCKTTATGFPYIVHTASGSSASQGGVSSLLVPAASIGGSSSSSSNAGSISSIGSGISSSVGGVGGSSSTVGGISTSSDTDFQSSGSSTGGTTSAAGSSGVNPSSSVDTSSSDSSTQGSSTSSSTDPKMVGLLSDISDMQHETIMNAVNNIGRRHLLRSDHIMPETVSNKRLLLQSTDYKLVCSTWNAVSALSFILFLLYSVSAVLAVLDIKSGHGLYVPACWRKTSAVQTAGNAAQQGGAVDANKTTPVMPATA